MAKKLSMSDFERESKIRKRFFGTDAVSKYESIPETTECFRHDPKDDLAIEVDVANFLKRKGESILIF